MGGTDDGCHVRVVNRNYRSLHGFSRRYTVFADETIPRGGKVKQGSASNKGWSSHPR